MLEDQLWVKWPSDVPARDAMELLLVKYHDDVVRLLTRPEAVDRTPAKFILETADELGVSVGTDGVDLVALIPLRLPCECRRSFERVLSEHRREIIEYIVVLEYGRSLITALPTPPRKRSGALRPRHIRPRSTRERRHG